MSDRMRRVNESIRQVLSEAVSELKDPRIGFVTVTGVSTTADLRQATVFVSVLGSEQARASTLQGLTAAHGVLIPLECEFFSLRGVALLIDTIDKVRERLNPKLEITGILPTMYDPRTLHCREVMARVVEAFGDVVFDSVINRTVRFPETTVAGEPITRWAPRSAGAKAYRELAREVIAR